mgnify:CR=1 FL=1
MQGKYRYVVLPFLFHGKTALGSKKVLQRAGVRQAYIFYRKILPSVEKENRL